MKNFSGESGTTLLSTQSKKATPKSTSFNAITPAILAKFKSILSEHYLFTDETTLRDNGHDGIGRLEYVDELACDQFRPAGLGE